MISSAIVNRTSNTHRKQGIIFLKIDVKSNVCGLIKEENVKQLWILWSWSL
jgi:hypothetical protein